MKEYAKKLSQSQINDIRDLKDAGCTYKQLSEKFGVATSTIQYHLGGEIEKNKVKNRARECTKRNYVKYKKAHDKYMQSDKGKRVMARSWIRHYLNKGIIEKSDLIDIANEF